MKQPPKNQLALYEALYHLTQSMREQANQNAWETLTSLQKEHLSLLDQIAASRDEESLTEEGLMRKQWLLAQANQALSATQDLMSKRQALLADTLAQASQPEMESSS